MKPLRKGAARTGLDDGLSRILGHVMKSSPLFDQLSMDQLLLLGSASARATTVQAALLGGAVEATNEELHSTLSKPELREFQADFWRLLNLNLWRLTRALEASKALDQVK